MSRRTYMVSRLPDGYQELQYIQNSGAAAFKVAYVLEGETPGFILKFGMPANYGGTLPVFGVRGGSTASNRNCYFAVQMLDSDSTASTADKLNFIRLVGTSSTSQLLGYNYNTGGIKECSEINLVVTQCDGTTVTLTSLKQTGNYDYIGIGSIWQRGSSAYVAGTNRVCYIGYLALLHGTTKDYEFIPALRKSDNKVGMYDLVSGNFYASETGTEFVAGPAA